MIRYEGRYRPIRQLFYPFGCLIYIFMSCTQNIFVYNLLLLFYLVVFCVDFLTNTTPQEPIVSGPNRSNDRKGYTKCRAIVIFQRVPSPLTGWRPRGLRSEQVGVGVCVLG